jgi:hypothetical protein
MDPPLDPPFIQEQVLHKWLNTCQEEGHNDDRRVEYTMRHPHLQYQHPQSQPLKLLELDL